MSDQFHESKARRPLRDVVSDIYKDILRLLMRRHNLLRKMHKAHPYLRLLPRRMLYKQRFPDKARKAMPRLCGSWRSSYQWSQFLNKRT